MKFIALYSPKQFFGFKGSTHKAQGGVFETEDNEVISFLKDHFAWKCDEVVKEVKKEVVKEPKVEKVEKPKSNKKGNK
jgi:hypothetical protein